MTRRTEAQDKNEEAKQIIQLRPKIIHGFEDCDLLGHRRNRLDNRCNPIKPTPETSQRAGSGAARNRAVRKISNATATNSISMLSSSELQSQIVVLSERASVGLFEMKVTVKRRRRDFNARQQRQNG